MPRFSFLHAADLHLDAPFTGVGRPPAAFAGALRDASLAAWDRLVERALARGVAAVCLAGGLCDGLDHGVRAPARLRSGLRRLAGAGIAVYIARAARDPFDALSEPWPDGVTVFAAGAPSPHALWRDGALLATWHGVSADAAGALPPPDAWRRDDAPGVHIGVVHAAQAAAADEPPACAVYRPDALRAAGLDYWALGHAHAAAQPASGSPWIVYPGTPQGRGLTAAECGAKGAVLVEVEDDRIARVSFEPLDAVRCLRVTAAAGAGEPDALRRALAAERDALRAVHGGCALVLEAAIDAAPAALCQPAARAALLAALRRDADAIEPFVWWANVRAVPAPGAAAGDDLAGEVLRLRAGLAVDAARSQRFLARRFEPLRYAWSADIEPREAAALLDAAAGLAVDALAAEDA